VGPGGEGGRGKGREGKEGGRGRREGGRGRREGGGGGRREGGRLVGGCRTFLADGAEVVALVTGDLVSEHGCAIDLPLNLQHNTPKHIAPSHCADSHACAEQHNTAQHNTT
jgi:hypothetical protein